MNQNHWNDGNEWNPGDGASRAPSSGPSYDGYGQNKNKRSGARIARWILVLVLCTALCFGAGALGAALMMRGADLLPDAQPESPVDLGDDETDLSPSGDGQGEKQDDPEQVNPSLTPEGSREDHAASIPADAQNREPDPYIEKQSSLGSVSYSGSAGQEAYATLAEAIDRVSDTVVEIFTETMVSGGWLGNYVTEGAGSGVIISRDGYIVTNHHVVSGAVSVTVRLTDGVTYDAQVVGVDEASDIAVLWIDADVTLPAAQLGCSADLIVGEHVFAIGNPLGSLGGTVTDGIISATAREINVGGSDMTLLQTNAAVNPGNSGGGLFNMAGKLIGIVNAKCSQDDVEGLGFAIPIDTAYAVIEQLIEYGYVRGVVDSGLELYTVSSSNIMVAWRYFDMTYSGVYVTESKYSDQLLYGDLILAIDGHEVSTAQQAKAIFSSYAVGDTVNITLLRLERTKVNGREALTEQKRTVELTLSEYVPEDVGVRFEGQ